MTAGLTGLRPPCRRGGRRRSVWLVRPQPLDRRCVIVTGGGGGPLPPLFAAAGRAGLCALKREGDGATPVGRFRPIALLTRADRLPLRCAALPHRALRDGDGWSDDPREAHYNRFVRVPRGNSHETLIRDDRLYDVIVVLDHNQRPRARGRGSAVFVHVARPGLTPTAGCLAFDRRDWQRRQLHTTFPAVLLVGCDPRPMRPSSHPRASAARSAPRRR